MNRVKAFGVAIKERRLELQLRQVDVAERTGLHVNFVSLVERGVRAPALDSVFAIADALDLPGSELLVRAEKAAARKGKS